MANTVLNPHEMLRKNSLSLLVSFTYAPNVHLNALFMPGIVLGVRETVMCKIDIVPALMKITV